jgi:hypothetical protein
MWNEKIDSITIFGKTVEHLQQHHAKEWTHINAKLKALREGSDGLTRLQRAIGLLRTDLQDDLVIDSIQSVIHDRKGAGGVLIGELHVTSRIVGSLAKVNSLHRSHFSEAIRI